MTLNLKEVIETHRDMLRPCPACHSKRLVIEERITRVTIFDLDTLKILPHIPFSDPIIHHGFRCIKCSTPIYQKTTKIKDEKNYFEVLAKLFKDMDHTKTKARLGNTRQATIKEVLKNG